MFADISQRMFSEIMSAFTEVAEMMTKIAKSAFVFNQMLSRCVINRRQNRELEKHQGKKTTSVDEKEKYEVKLHAALVLSITYWAIYEPRRDKGFQQQSELILLSPPATRREKSPCIEG